MTLCANHLPTLMCVSVLSRSSIKGKKEVICLLTTRRGAFTAQLNVVSFLKCVHVALPFISPVLLTSISDL